MLCSSAKRLNGSLIFGRHKISPFLFSTRKQFDIKQQLTKTNHFLLHIHPAPREKRLMIPLKFIMRLPALCVPRQSFSPSLIFLCLHVMPRKKQQKINHEPCRNSKLNVMFTMTEPSHYLKMITKNTTRKPLRISTFYAYIVSCDWEFCVFCCHF